MLTTEHYTRRGKELPASASLDINALLEFSRLLNQSDDPAFVFNNVLFSLMGKLGLGRAAVALPEEDGGFRVTYAKGGAIALVGFELPWKGSSRTGVSHIDELEEIDDIDRERLREARIERILPLSFADATFGIVLLGSSMAMRPIGPDELSYASLIGAIAAMALEGCRVRGSLREANRSLERRVHRLRDLFEGSKEFNALLDRDAILRLLGLTLMGGMAIARFAVVLCGESGYDVVVNRFRRELPEEALHELASAGGVILTDEEHPMGAVLYPLGIRASIPMEVQGKTRGILLIGERLQHRVIDTEDMEYLSAFANLAMIALENARLLEEMIEKQRLEEDLKIAWEIQQGLLPKKLPQLPGYEIAAETIPARQVGGDCYDVIDLDDGRILFSIADVSGKGTPASLLMANVQAALRALAPLDLPLTDLVSRINDVIFENTSYDKFITAFFGVLESSTGRFAYVNAGHNPPFLFARDAVTPLSAGGLILGVMPTTIPYETDTVTIEQGDLLILYTDGVSEALNPEREEYGEDRLRALFEGNRSVTSTDALAHARADLLSFARGAQQSDDITLLVIRRIESIADCELRIAD